MNANRTVISCNSKICRLYEIKSVGTALKRSKKIIRSFWKGFCKAGNRSNSDSSSDNADFFSGRLFKAVSAGA